MSIKTVYLAVNKYQDPYGNETCALDVTQNYVCLFLRTRRFGTQDYCAYLEKEVFRGDGYLTPDCDCPLRGKG